MMRKILDDIFRARERISPYIHETPVDYSTTFSRMTQSEVYLKLENLQKTGSFKVRGAFNKILEMKEEERKRGVIAVSAGNHAQGVAYAAMTLGIKSTIVMPETAPISKYKATKGYGAEVILYGKFIHESMKKAEELIRERNLTLVHPYDDPLIIAGQGTAGLEMAKEKPDVVIVPIGGGGLISGVSVALKGINPNTKVIGVQSFASPSLKISKELGRLTDIEPSYSIADGILVKSPSSLTFEIVSEYVDDIVLVDDDEIAWAMMMLLERSKTVVEPAGAAPLAALLSGKVEARGKKVMALLSGGNVDLSLLARIIDKTLYKTKRIVKARVIVPDKPGYLNKVLNHVAQIRGNIIDVVHDRVSSDVLPGYTKIYVMFEVAEQEDLGKFIVSLQNENIEVKLIE
ncbi:MULTISPECIES: threonine ammonia-lyase [Metallosphaera]|uniref:threonine ammonia-lyase n=3 Tax=Metallosphaera TaxID=41980 RepID=A4YCN6_METS5|nr:MULTISPECIES: threonine ammonia-lyase [Metallosphaera]ABP94188.1 L-threonine ammonia-lyase [Metallosphaera sedula DSM 5348]AIM26175.1 L-threonine ammonia-lyase [Metallosphaera sedula]AKV73202.1 threonine dehydratase [Metallosphaera sedula]AKV75446.1 threonine dehydratase [Metallosphaera sedula]AKV77692.1 threonine dehydratase [Metallosphaera sedula]